MPNIEILGDNQRKGKYDSTLADVVNRSTGKEDSLKVSSYDVIPEGRPIAYLKPLDNTAVHTPTLNDFLTLLNVYECGGWQHQFNNEGKVDILAWLNKKEKTCVEVSNNSQSYDERSYFENKGFRILSLGDFCIAQNIDSETLSGIKSYFHDITKFKISHYSGGEK